MKLHFYFTPSTCALASHIALEESGAAFEAELVKLHKPEDVVVYKQINPRGTVPALTVDGVLLTEANEEAERGANGSRKINLFAFMQRPSTADVAVMTRQRIELNPHRQATGYSDRNT